MLTKEQAENAADKVLADGRLQQITQHLATQRRLRLRKWAGAGAVVGFAVAWLVGQYLVESVFLWPLAGLGIGAAIGLAWGSRAA